MSTQKNTVRTGARSGGTIVLSMFLVATAMDLNAQFHEKKEARIADSELPQNVKGGTTFQVTTPYRKAYDTALSYLKREGHTIDSAAADTGQIITAMEIKGGYTQTGTRIQVMCIKDSDTQTSVRVVVTEQKRKKLLQTEPWGDAKVNEAASSEVADHIKTAIGH